MTTPPGPTISTIRVPRWIQLVGLPVGLLIIWMLAGVLGHVLFLFLTASVIAFLLNPLVRDLKRLRLPRGLAVALVFLLFAAAVAFIVLTLGGVVVDQARSAAERIDDYVTLDGSTGSTGAELDIDRLQRWLDTHGLESIQIEKQATDWIDNLGAGEVSGYTQDAISFAQGAAFSLVVALFNLVLIVVIAIYMLLDMERLESVVDRRFPPGDGLRLTRRIEKALAGYVRGQLILSTVIGASAGLGMWLLGTIGLVPGAERYALLFGVWTGVIEVIPFIGPWLSAIPPTIYALIVDPVSALWVIALFIFIYQVEGHIVVPNVMATALRLHPLLVIFGLLAGGELYGIAGVLMALPTMAAARAIWEFFSERVRFDSWDDGAPMIGVDVEGPPDRASDVPLPE
ncbi:MAG: AI-2E family transporter [Thermoleophilia bacterium]|nr:AI-2E family transporter [Thermoleophilia bacterium]